MTLRKKIPVRSRPKQETQYRNYKSQLQKDFNMSCGYCDDSDENFGFTRGFHIDHFAPHSIFPNLITEYTNLVYSCPLCNGAKSDKWIGKVYTNSHNGTKGFIDPCLSEYDDHLIRDAQGHIHAKTELGDYLVKNLKLSLLSHQLNWQIRKLDELKVQLAKLASELGDKAKNYDQIQENLIDLIITIDEYKKRRSIAP